ncbi:MAG: SxtJ family membrane protein, partial [Candidatus Eisenbacteria bacterium]|nr:SxtJ family membrane protein [Candidatus Eisenbacteria bacterium]
MTDPRKEKAPSFTDGAPVLRPRRQRSEATEARRFSIILALLTGAIAALSLWRGHPTRAEILAGIGALSLLCAFLLRPLWIRFFRLWMRFAEALSWVSTRVILTLVYFLIVTPYGVVSRPFRRDPLDMDWKRRRPSYWVDRPEKQACLLYTS